MNAKLAALQKQLATDSSLIPHTENIRREQMRMLADTGAFRVHAVQEKSAVENYTRALQKQDVVFRGWTKNAKLRNDVLKEQYRLQRASVIGWREDGMGRMTGDMIVPRDVPERLGNFRKGLADVRNGQASLGTVVNETRMRIGLWTEGVQSASKNLVNWGKNTQWAGRQMMVGLTLPFAALAAGTGALAYQIDKEMTRVLKVYDYATTNIEAEGERVKESTMATARAMANMYGQSAQDTIGIIAELAATGKTGIELQKSAEVVSRASMLGELDRQDAIKTTISLQTVFKQNTDELAASFDFLNALENATSLSMRDMTVAIPKLSGVVKALGGDYKDMGIMMAAAKAAGLEAAEGANMLKTVMFRAVSPYGKGAETFAEKTNIDLKALVASTNGEAIPTFIKMGKAMEAANLTNPDRAAVLKDVFGVYQGSKAGQFIEQMLDVADATTQAGQAAIMAGKSTEELAAIAEREVKRMQQSASGQFKIALESIKVELADIGEPFLKVATHIINFVTKIFKAFNGLSDTKKQIVLFGLAFLAVVGPLVMITGVVATLIGTVIKMGASLLMMSARFRAVNADQMSASLLAKGSAAAFRDEATAAQLLSYQLGEINAKLTTMAGAATAAALAAGKIVPAAGIGAYQTAMAPNVVTKTDKRGRERYYQVDEATGKKSQVPAATGAAWIQANQNAAKGAADAEKAMNGVAEGTEKARRRILSMNTGLASGVGMMAMMVGGTNKWIFGLGIVLTMLPLIQAGLAGIGKLSAFKAMGAGITGIMGKVKGLGGIAGGLARTLAGLAPALGPLGLVLAAAGAAAGVLWYKLKKTREEAQALVDSSKGMASAMGVELLTPGQHVEEDGTKTTNSLGLAQQFEKENASSVNALRKLGENIDNELGRRTFENRIIQIGFDIYKATGDAKKAKQAVDAALIAAGHSEILIDVDFANAGWRAGLEKRLLEGLAEVSSTALESGSWYDRGLDESVEVQLKERAMLLAQSFGQWQEGTIDLEALEAQFDAVVDSFAGFGEKFVAQQRQTFSPQTVSLMENYFNKEMESITNAEIARAMLTDTAFYESLDKSGTSSYALASSFRGLRESYTYLSKETTNATGLQNLQGVETKDLSTLTRGLEDNTAGAAGATENLGTAATGATDDLEGLAPAIETAEEAASRLVDAQKQMMGQAWGDILEFAGDQVEAAHESAIDNMEASGKRRVDALEAEAKARNKEFERQSEELDDKHKGENKKFTLDWDHRRKVIEDSYDTRVKKIEDTMEAERKAEELRQKAFEAEKNRIQRLSELYNQNIDFNVALNSGDMDEAAKIANDMRASQQQWALDDAAAVGTDAQALRDEANQQKISGINSDKEARLETLQEAEDAAKAALERRQEAEKDALEAEKERYKESVDARKAAEEQKTKAAVDGSKKSFEARKKALDGELAVLKAFIPRNQAELEQHTARIEAAYRRHGFNLNTKSKEWAAYVATAMTNATNVAAQEMSTNTKWDQLGRTVGDQIGKQILGMSFADFIKWMQTGELPNPPAAKGAGAGSATSGAPTGYTGSRDMRAPGVTFTTQDGRKQSDGRSYTGRHSGGPIGKGGSSRAGRPLSAGLYTDEVPIIAQKGEFMMQREAVKRIGEDNLHAMNQGRKGPDKTGRMHRGGLVSSVGGMVSSLLQRGLAKAMMVGASRKVTNIMSGEAPGQIPGKAMQMMQSGSTVGGVDGYGSAVKFSAPGLPLGLSDGTGLLDPSISLPGGFLPGSYQGTGAFRANGGTVTGDVQGLRMEFLRRLASWAAAVGKPYNVGSGYRSMAEQAYLYDRWMRRVPGQAQAAPPGASNHNYGLASDGPHWGHLNPGRFGLRYPMSYEPWHVEPMNARGMRAVVPGLKVGGTVQYDNTIANLHKNETVLTAPLSKQLANGIANLDSGVANEYNITMDFRGAVIREDVDIEKAVAKVLQAQESKMGRKRTIK